MNHAPELIVMLTQNDKTLPDAAALFECAKHSRAKNWGFKEKPLPPEEMKRLAADMKACGKTTFLEVVEYTEPECLEGARIAVECGFDVLMGTLYFDSVNELCRAAGIKYMPFVGKVTERPSILDGTAEEMIREAQACLQKGVYGFDLLGYRYTGDATELSRKFVEAVNAPVCVAGSVNGFARLDELKEIRPWSFTVGTAFFDGSFEGTLAQQIDTVCAYMEGESC